MDERIFWGWAIMGLGGAVNIVQKLNDAGGKVTAHFLGELKKVRDQLDSIIKHQEGKQDGS